MLQYTFEQKEVYDVNQELEQAYSSALRDPLQHGPITRVMTKRFKEALNELVQDI